MIMMFKRGIASLVVLIATAIVLGEIAQADTTSWNVSSLEWLVDTSDSIFVAKVLGSEDTDKWGIQQRHRLKITETIKQHPDAPESEAVLENWTGYEPGDVLVVFWDARFAENKLRPSDKKRVINTSKPVELIHFLDPQERRSREYAFLAMDALGKVIETREELIRRIRLRMKDDVDPISKEEARRAEGAYPFNQSATAAYKRHDPELYESYGYDVVISLLIPMDPATLKRMAEKGRDYTSTPTSYLGAQAVLTIAEVRKLEDRQSAKLASEKESLRDVMAWARRAPDGAALFVNHQKSAVTYAGPAEHRYLLSPGGRILFDLGPGCTAYDVATGERLFHLDVEVRGHSLRFGPAGRYMAWHDGESVVAVDISAGKLLFAVKTRRDNGLRFTSDGKKLAYLDATAEGTYELTIRELEENRGATVGKLTGIEGRVELEDVGESGAYALLRGSNLGGHQFFVASLRTATHERLPNGVTHAAIVARDRAVAMLIERLAKESENDADVADSAVKQRGEAEPETEETLPATCELIVRSLADDALLLQATLPAEYEAITPIGDDLISVCQAPTLEGGQCLFFSIHSDRVRGQVLERLRR